MICSQRRIQSHRSAEHRPMIALHTNDMYEIYVYLLHEIFRFHQSAGGCVVSTSEPPSLRAFLSFFFFCFFYPPLEFLICLSGGKTFSVRHNHETKSRKVSEDESEQKSMPPAVADTKDTWRYKSFVTSITTFCVC